MVGILVAAAAATALIMPASHQFSTLPGLGWAALIIGLPVAVILAVSGAPHYGVLRSLAVSIVAALITCAVSLVVGAYTFATAIASSASAVTAAVVLYAAPALSVLIVGFLALRTVPARVGDEESASAAR